MSLTRAMTGMDFYISRSVKTLRRMRNAEKYVSVPTEKGAKVLSNQYRPEPEMAEQYSEKKMVYGYRFIICLTIIVYYFSKKVNDLVIFFCEWREKSVIC